MLLDFESVSQLRICRRRRDYAGPGEEHLQLLIPLHSLCVTCLYQILELSLDGPRCKAELRRKIFAVHGTGLGLGPPHHQGREETLAEFTHTSHPPWH